MSLRDSGHSFVYHPKNDLATAHVDVTALRLSESENGEKMMRDGNWHPKLTADYLRRVDLFRKLLLFCVHVTGGQPARGTEILSLRLKNGCVRPRNIFLLDGYVMTVTFYNKTDSQWDSPKIIPRFLPWRVGQLLASYLVYIQPLAALMGDAIGSGSCQSEYVWAHKSESADNLVPWDTRKLTEMINTRSGKDLGEVFGTLDYRHIAIGMGRKYVGQHFAKDCFTDEMDDVQDEEIAIEDPLEMSAGRGTATGAARYAVRSDLVEHLTQDNIDTLRPQVSLSTFKSEKRVPRLTQRPERVDVVLRQVLYEIAPDGVPWILDCDFFVLNVIHLVCETVLGEMLADIFPAHADSYVSVIERAENFSEVLP
ncbi:hypothetical protein E4U51_000671 [Claviceps purpurea]|nr:hypothetical protein E4U51_000671 [Claviceps purpurea]